MSAAELDELDRRRDAGEVSANEYDVERARILADASRPQRSQAMNVILTLMVVVGLLIVVQLIV